MEKLLYEGTPNAPITINPGTGQSDIANFSQNLVFARGIMGMTLPYAIGYVQPINGPEGFIYGLKHRDQTNITHSGTTNDDFIITRKPVVTDVREVILDSTNEVIYDVNSLFGDRFPEVLQSFLESGGLIYPDGNGNTVDNFFLSVSLNRIIRKTNTDFTTWLSTEASIKGSTTINTYDDMARIFGVIGELREALYKQTKKISRVWILVTPRIAGFLSSTVGSTMSNGADIFNQGRIIPSNRTPNYVMTMGDIDVYQYDPFNNVTGGSSNTTETNGRIYMGYIGGPNVSSIIYAPYREYFIKGGDDYRTGQSSIFYRIRDTWETNSQDTYDIVSVDNTDISQSTTDPRGTNKSQYIVAADITFNENLVQ